jgi:Ulp1 family protease
MTLVIPLNPDGKHWFLGAIHGDSSTIAIYDSLKKNSENSSEQSQHMSALQVGAYYMDS